MRSIISKALFCGLINFIPFELFSASIIENKGQVNKDISNKEQVLFYTAINGGYAYFLKDRIAIVLSETTKNESFNNITTGSKKNNFRYDLKIKCSNEMIVEKGSLLSEKINIYKGGEHFIVSQYNKLTYRNRSEGMSLVFYNHPEKGLKYDIVFDDPKNNEINFFFELIGAVANKDIDPATKKEIITIKTPLGIVTEKFPLIYADLIEKKGPRRIEKTCNISIINNIISYSVTVPKNCNSIVIDPWTSFAGGSDVDENFGVDGDEQGNVYISGYTQSIDFPSTPGAFQTNLNANYDAYIFKFDPSGQRLWATYYGGSQNDFGYRLKVSPSGKPTISGYTYSNDLYVSTSGVFSSTFSGSIDAFITQFDMNGNFVWGTFAGGTGGDFAIGMDMDKLGFIALSGFTSSNDFPVSAGAWQSVAGGALDSFLAKFDSTGNRVWSSYMGGINSEDAHAIKFDSFGNVIIAGDTYSANFPVSAGAYQNFLMTGGDAYVAKFNSSGINIWSTFLGGSGNEDISSLACDNYNNIYFTGYTSSIDFPCTSGAFQTTMQGVRDMTIGSFSAFGNLRWLTYSGGAAWDVGQGIIVNTNEKITVCGETSSMDFPIVGNKYDTVTLGSSDIAYITLDTAGTVELSNYWGGSSTDYPRYICEVTQSKIVIAGSTYSIDLPVTAGVFQTIQSGDVDAFVWQIDTASIITETPNKIDNATTYLYPNPANEKVIITGLDPGNYELFIYEISGKEICHQKIICDSTIQINELNNFPSGIYSILLYSNQKRLVFTLILP